MLAVTVSNGGALSPFADANGFASDGGAVAVISLARSATALFTLDGLTLSLALTATNAGRTVSETVSFASSARGFDGLGLSLHLTTALLRPETELFAAADANLTIWHNDGKEESYELSGLDSQLFAADAGGGVRVASDLPVSGEGAFYELTLRLTDGAANAERLLFLRLTPPLPEIEGELLGETKLVNALSGSGTALLAVTVSNGGALLSFADANGFASDGGAVAVISLARSATALFTLDGLALSLALTATNAGGTVSETVSFASSARGFDGLELTLHLTTALLRPETELFAAADSSLTIWHNDDKKESYELSGLDSQLFVAGANGEVRVASDLPVSGEGAFYELTLRLTDGAAIAGRLLFLRLTPPLPEIEGVSGEAKLVNALSGSGTALLAVTVSNGGALSPIADANGFASGGGAVAVISLARSATALFTLDGLALSLALTATNAGGTVSETVSFASSALGIDGAGLFASFATVMLPSETEVFAAADARLTIWHNDGKQETYGLSGADASLFAVDVNGGVRTASDLLSENDLLYELTLRLTDGAVIAERLLTLALLLPPIAVVYPIIYPAVAVSLPAGTFSAPKRFLSESTEVFPSEKVRMAIAHNANKSALYTLEGEYSELFVVDEHDGGVRTFRDESLGESLNYELTLRLMNGESVISERLLFLRLTLHAIEPRSALPLQDVGCTGQWPCRDQFAEALAAATESGEATLDHERLLVLDVSTSKGDHGAHVYSVVERFGSGARVRLWTEWNFLSVVTKKKQIVNHSVAGELIASAGTLEEKDVIVTQAAGNDWSLNPSFPGFFDNPSDVTAAVETGLMIVVGGIGKVSERYYPTKKQRLRYEYVPESSWPSVPVYAPIDLDDPSTFTDYCDGRNRFRYGISTGGLGPDVFTKDGEGWCSVYDRCGWMQNYCLVAPAMRVPTYAQGSRSTESNGTSVSAPQIAAALQMLGDMWPELSQYDLAQMALLLADDIGDIGIDEVYGHGALSFRQLYVPGGLSFATEDGIFRFSCDADANTCQKGRP